MTRGLRFFSVVGVVTFISGLAAAIPIAELRLVAQGLEEPVTIAAAPNDPSRVFLLERWGRIKIIETATDTIRPTPFLDFSSVVGTEGNANSVGLVFDPQYATNGYFYVHYAGSSSFSTVARYQVSNDPNVANASSATIIFRCPRGAYGHDGGSIGFGPDGYLYITEGDSGNGVVADPENAAQNLSDRRGKMHRIDIRGDDFPADANANYRVPSNNPFASTSNRASVWAYGLRNPFQASFDRATGDFWITDIGQNDREEINFQPAGFAGGANYGWRCVEGDLCTGLSGCACPLAGATAPILAYGHNVGCSISGGVVYRGTTFSTLQGWFMYSDFCTNFMRAVRRDAGGGISTRDLATDIRIPPLNAITSIAEDSRGEIWIVDYSVNFTFNTGRVFKLVPYVPCVADLDDGSGAGTRDDGVDINDLIFFLRGFEAGDVRVDVDDNGAEPAQPDGGVDINDLVYFLRHLEQGC